MTGRYAEDRRGRRVGRRAGLAEFGYNLAQDLAGIGAGGIRQHACAEIGLDAAQGREDSVVEGGERALLARVPLDDVAGLLIVEFKKALVESGRQERLMVCRPRPTRWISRSRKSASATSMKITITMTTSVLATGPTTGHRKPRSF